jgi:hypothetical protein
MGKSRLSSYSGGVRQQLLQLAVKGAWAERYNISIGDRRDVPGDYSALLAQSLFCAVVPGVMLLALCFVNFCSQACMVYLLEGSMRYLQRQTLLLCFMVFIVSSVASTPNAPEVSNHGTETQ